VFWAPCSTLDVAQEHRRTVLVGHHDILIGLGILQLVVGIDGVGLHRAVEAAFGRVGIVVGDGGAQIVDVQAQRRQPLQIGLNAHGRTLAAGNADQTDARQLRNFLCDACVRQVLDRGDGEAGGRYRQGDHGGVRGIDLGIDRRSRQQIGQKTVGGVDRRLHFLLGDIQRKAEIELQGDDRRAGRGDGRHLLQARHLAKLLFQGRGDRGGHHVRARAGQEGLDLDGGIIHFRQG